MNTRRFFIAAIVILCGLSSALATVQPRVEASSLPAPLTADDARQTDTCQVILARAMQALNSNCDKLERNRACYGNKAVEAELQNPVVKFNALGDKVPIQAIRKLTTSPLDLQQGTWGLSLLKLQANLPDTMPGQNVMFLVFGNISIENTSGDMRSFYFTSGLGSPTCKEAPQDGILVKSPKHTEVTFKANGVQITIASTVMLRAERHKKLDVSLIEGRARVTTPQGTQTLQPGQTASVALGGSNGLEPADKPSHPAPAPVEPAVTSMITSTQPLTPPSAPVNTSIDGCVTNVQGDTATIHDQAVKISGNGSALGGAKVGDCVHISGSIKGDEKSSFVVPSIVSVPKLSDSEKIGKNDDENAGVSASVKDKGKDSTKDKDKDKKDKDRDKGSVSASAGAKDKDSASSSDDGKDKKDKDKDTDKGNDKDNGNASSGSSDNGNGNNNAGDGNDSGAGGGGGDNGGGNDKDKDKKNK